MGIPDRCATPAPCHTVCSGLGVSRGGGHGGVTSPERAVLIFKEESQKAENKRGRQ